MLALVNEGGAKSMFLYGAMAAGKAPLRVQKVGRDLGFMLDFERRLRHGLPMRVIGLLDDASATLIVDMARSGGARMQWLGQHTAEDGFTRHHVLSTDMSEGCSQQLSRQLHDCGAGFKLIEERQNGPMAPRQLTGRSRGASQSVSGRAALVICWLRLARPRSWLLHWLLLRTPRSLAASFLFRSTPEGG